MDDALEPLRVVIVGTVDHGKSTLIGRLLNEAGALPEDRVAALEEISRKRGVELEWAFVTDALQAERDGGTTIDTSEAVFRTARRRFAIIDAPGQEEFLRNMVTGAASAELAIVVVDATEGAMEQSRRHLYLLTLLGIKRLIVVVNKMDKVDYSADCFAAAADQVRRYLQQIGIAATAIIPIAAKHGHMIAERPGALSWYHGPTLMEALDRLEPEAVAPEVLALRFTVQDIYKFDERRIIAGRIESGVLRVGDALSFMPGGSVARVASIEDWNRASPRQSASAGESIGITLDQRAFVERGHVASLASEPLRPARRLTVRLFWLASEALTVGRSLTLQQASGQYRAKVWSIESVIDLHTLEKRPAGRVLTNQVAEIVLEAADPIPVDRFAALPRTGRLVLTDAGEALGGAVVLDLVEAELNENAAAVYTGVARIERERRNRHRGAVLWLTGLPGSGKSTLAAALERALFEGGMHAVVIDTDLIRRGLSIDLGFAPADRTENTRRVAEMAKLLADAGNVAIAALVSPLKSDRDLARSIVGDGFAEIYVRADLALCEARDPKGLYARARRGEIAFYAGINGVYEAPVKPDLTIDTGKLDIAEAVDQLVGFVDDRFHDPRIDQKLVEPEWSV
ncbi:MAG TPA: adenylyl-sulfate kinase [Alphaproteobacteria bacterium]|jgi:bifunctional enzyme CysN/CysC|nr:adenylyl-sulfate kinase [Alphaproteobacteria bacterium]